MNSILILASGSVALAALVMWMRSLNRFNSLLTYLLVVLLLLVLLPGFDRQQDGLKLTGFLLALLSAGWISSRLITHKFAHLIGLALVGLILFWKNSSVSFQDYPLLFNAKNVLMLPVLGAAFPLLIRMKAGFLSRFFGIDRNRLLVSLELIGVGILALISLFFGSVYGLVLTATGYLLTEWFDTQRSSSGGLALLLTAFACWLIPNFAIEPEPFLHGSTLIGLFGGIGLVCWIGMSEQMENTPNWKKILYFLIIPVIILAFMLIEKLKEHLGGIQSLAGIILMLAVGSIWLGQKAQRLYLATLALTIGTALFLGPQFKPLMPDIPDELFSQFDDESEDDSIEQEEMQTASTPTDTLSTTIKKTDDRLTGLWEIDGELSLLEFELGPPDAKTKGAIKNMTGNFTFDTLPGKSKLEVKLPLSGLTTFNNFRDESLMGSEFFDAQKFPEMAFRSVSMKQQGKKLSINGDFEMRGLKQRLSIPMTILKRGSDAQGAFLLLKGVSKLDRTKHDMDPDPKIGDLVEFSLKIKVRQNK